jgi:glycine cleavage system H protein
MKKFTEDHEWIEIENGNVAKVGITNYAQGELGDIVFLDCAIDQGNEIKQGEVFGSVEAVKTVSDLLSPASGIIIEFNDILEDNPEKINEDAEGDGWIIKIELTDINELDSLMTEEEYLKMINI